VERKYTGAAINAKAYLSYSRQDLDVAQRLVADLSKQSVEVWVDFEDIPASADWQAEINAGIDSADAFIIMVSQNSLTSNTVNREIDYARSVNKRIIPILVGDIDETNLLTRAGGRSFDRQSDPTDLTAGFRNWQTFKRMQIVSMRVQDDYEAGFRTLMNGLASDLDYIQQHTRLLVRAREWDRQNRDTSYLLRGTELESARTWLSSAAEKQPTPTTLHSEYINQSNQYKVAQLAELERQRAARVRTLAFIILGMVLIVAVIVSIISLSNASALSNAAATSDANAAAAIFAQGEALTQAGVAATAQGAAEINATLAFVAQGEALMQATTAVAAQRDAENQRDSGVCGTGGSVDASDNRSCRTARRRESSDYRSRGAIHQ